MRPDDVVRDMDALTPLEGVELNEIRRQPLPEPRTFTRGGYQVEEYIIEGQNGFNRLVWCRAPLLKMMVPNRDGKAYLNYLVWKRYYVGASEQARECVATEFDAYWKSPKQTLRE